MCLISFNWLDHPIYKLVLVGNRDEFFDRPSASLHKWPSGMYAGKDLRGGGTWMGFHPKGKFAALTNYRISTLPSTKNFISRGNLVKDYLENQERPLEYLYRIQKKMDQYDGFNLLVSDGEEMGYLCNFQPQLERVSPGLHGISNAFLDTPWYKVVHAKAKLQKLMVRDEINENELTGVLQSRSYAPDGSLPQTGIPLEMERILSAQFIQMGNDYGTVNTSIILWKHDGSVVFVEKRTVPKDENRIAFKIQPDARPGYAGFS